MLIRAQKFTKEIRESCSFRYALMYLKVLFARCSSQLLHEAHNVERQLEIRHAILRSKNGFDHALDDKNEVRRVRQIGEKYDSI